MYRLIEIDFTKPIKEQLKATYDLGIIPQDLYVDLESYCKSYSTTLDPRILQNCIFMVECIIKDIFDLYLVGRLVDNSNHLFVTARF